ncbi:hypothetical protein HNO88_004119 [Novosphingobium chloroacetimidivorans]|uniref:PilZ domain-containing protein n=1 Tax=Novosphingobium chloroacetimidivorans TaxID=1428314 RepID=A0A7W7KDD6_9SPHN|nr:PilZ domain-containing protein [Novosphingobium chloroacetimidivorans]MBB4860774.1 hypothetical protein [Novosphingobium chloroacetimidivorans]
MVPHSSSSFDNPRGRRESARLRVRLAARLVSRSGTQHVILTDLSTYGAQVIAGKPLRVGDEVMLLWSGFEAFGDVAWSAARHYGIRLADPLGQVVLVGTRQLDATERLPAERELTRRSAQSFVKGNVRL